jgi:hypothetical protein
MMKHFAKIQLDFLKFAQDDMSGEVHKEREKRIELSELPRECKDIKPVLIKQCKLRDVRNGDKSVAYVRVRMIRDVGEEPKYSLGVKHLPLQQEVETDISKDMFECFYPDNCDGAQEKLRYSLSSGWDVDKIVESSRDSGKIFAEYEYGKGEDVAIPLHWKVKP